MNIDPTLMTDKFEELVDLAKNASTGFERSAVFAATQEISRLFFAEKELKGYILEQVRSISTAISDVLGYTNNYSFDRSDVLRVAREDIYRLRDALARHIREHPDEHEG